MDSRGAALVTARIKSAYYMRGPEEIGINVFSFETDEMAILFEAKYKFSDNQCDF
jgi:hypothetical protein